MELAAPLGHHAVAHATAGGALETFQPAPCEQRRPALVLSPVKLHKCRLRQPFWNCTALRVIITSLTRLEISPIRPAKLRLRLMGNQVFFFSLGTSG
jgi:hypothetical protein